MKRQLEVPSRAVPRHTAPGEAPARRAAGVLRSPVLPLLAALSPVALAHAASPPPVRGTPVPRTLACPLPRTLASPLPRGAAMRPEADVTSYTVRLSAAVQSDPAQIALSWVADATATGYTVYRKPPASTSWGNPVATLSSAESGYVDAQVVVGTAYEYKVVKAGSPTGYGYLLSGIEIPLVDERGTVVLLVDSTYATDLAIGLEQLQDDLVGDGWVVRRYDVAPEDDVAAVRALVQDEYTADPAGARAVFLFGHVPIPQSGYMAPDGHESRPFPADPYYGDVDGLWTDSVNYASSNVAGDGIFDQNYIPSDVELEVGRLDLWNLPAFAGLSELELLDRYLEKDHAFRHRLFDTQAAAFIDDNFGEFSGEAFAQNGWRNFSPFFGPAAVTAGDWKSGPAMPYQWAYGCGGGSYTSCSGVVTSSEMQTYDPAVFTMLFGSYFGEWDAQDDLMRSELATSDYGLTCAWAGRPNWFVHHLGLGETIGHSTRLSQNNGSPEVYSPMNYMPRGVHVALMGDPTLSMFPVAPATGLEASFSDYTVTLSWQASPDGVRGYHVYRATDAAGPFERLTEEPVTDTSYVDTGFQPGTNTWMVRAVALTTTASGSYLHAAQGAFVSLTIASDVDYDGDGYTAAEGDCDETDEHINPGEDELADGIDNDCDGEIDEIDSGGCARIGGVGGFPRNAGGSRGGFGAPVLLAMGVVFMRRLRPSRKRPLS